MAREDMPGKPVSEFINDRVKTQLEMRTTEVEIATQQLSKLADNFSTTTNHDVHTQLSHVIDLLTSASKSYKELLAKLK